MKYDSVKELSEDQFRRLTGVKKVTLKRIRRNSQHGVELVSLEKCNTKTQRVKMSSHIKSLVLQ